MNLYCINYMRITGNIGKVIMSYDDESKGIKIFTCSDICASKRCQNINGKYIDGLMKSI